MHGSTLPEKAKWASLVMLAMVVTLLLEMNITLKGVPCLAAMFPRK
jgi:hypothetical protein